LLLFHVYIEWKSTKNENQKIRTMENSKIEWTDHTANPWWGCTKVHEGCDNCYACALAGRYGHKVWGKGNLRKEVKSFWATLTNLQKKALAIGNRQSVFVGSMMDIFEKPMPLADWQGNELIYDTGEVRHKLFENINSGLYPNLIFLFLTKRPGNINKYIPENWKQNPPENVIFGTSPVNQLTADKLIPQLLQVNGRRFLSVEPQLEELTLLDWLHSGQIHWVIQGGESGPGKRHFDTDWARKLLAECKTTGIPYFFKQVDKVKPIPEDLTVREFYSNNIPRKI
jgi:protein gp37